MEKSYNIYLPINHNINHEQNKGLILLNESSNISHEKNDKINSINFNHKKRRREEIKQNNNNINNNFCNSNNINFNPLEKKFLSFQEFSNMIKKELQNHKIKRKDFFNQNNISIFNPDNANSNNYLLLDKNTNINNTPEKEQNNKNPITNSNIYKVSLNNKNISSNSKTSINERDKANNNYINSSQNNIIVSVSPSNNKKDIHRIKFDNFGNGIIFNDIKGFRVYKNRKKYIKQVSVSLIAGAIIIGFVYFIVDENQKNEIKYFLNCFSILFWIIILCLILIIIIIILIYYKNNEKSSYNKIAFEDFEILKKLLYKIFFDNKDEYTGLFQTQFIQDCSNKRNMEEDKYIKFVLPLINKLIEKYNDKQKENQNKTIKDIEHNLVIKEYDINISGQKKKLWKYIEFN